MTCGRPWISLWLVLAACGPSLGSTSGSGSEGETETEGESPSGLAERCGTDEPIQLLALAPEETIEQVGYGSFIARPHDTVFRHGDRYLVTISTFDRPLTPDVYGQSDDPPQLVSSRVVSVDACGGDVFTVLESGNAVRPPQGDEPWIACADDHPVAFDPDVPGRANVIPELHCSDDVVDGILVAWMAVETSPGVLARARLSLDGPDDVAPLVEGFAHVFPVGDTPKRVLQNADDQIVEVDVHTGVAVVVHADEFYDWGLSDDGRLLWWHDVSTGNQAGTDAPIWLWDRETGGLDSLGVPEWDGQRTFGILRDALAIRPPTRDPNETQIVLFEGHDVRVFEGDWFSVGHVGNTYALVDALTEEPQSSLMLVESGSDDVRPIELAAWADVWVTDQSVWILDTDDDREAATPPRYRLRELAAPDFEPREVGRDLWYPRRLADGRYLFLTDRDAEERFGTLVLVQHDGTQVEIDHDVLEERELENVLEDDTLVYMVRDPSFERAGVWIAQIAPSPAP